MERSAVPFPSSSPSFLLLLQFAHIMLEQGLKCPLLPRKGYKPQPEAIPHPSPHPGPWPSSWRWLCLLPPALAATEGAGAVCWFHFCPLFCFSRTLSGACGVSGEGKSPCSRVLLTPSSLRCPFIPLLKMLSSLRHWVLSWGPEFRGLRDHILCPAPLISPFVFSVPAIPLSPNSLPEYRGVGVGINTQRPHDLGWGVREGGASAGASNKTFLVPALLGYHCQRPRLRKALGNWPQSQPPTFSEPSHPLGSLPL